MSELEKLQLRVERLEKLITNSSNSNQKNLITSKEVCKRIGFGQKWFYKHRADLIDAGMFKAGRWLISEENLTVFINKKKIIN